MELQSQGWPLVRVDCEEDKELCRTYKVAIYPTIRIFHGSDHSIYNGYRKADAMVSLMNRHSRPTITKLSSAQDVSEFRSKDRVTVVAYLSEGDEQANAIFTDVAETYREQHSFAIISDDKFGQIENVQKPAILLYKTFDEGKASYTADFDAEKVIEFLAKAATPLIREIGVDIKARAYVVSSMDMHGP